MAGRCRHGRERRRLAAAAVGTALLLGIPNTVWAADRIQNISLDITSHITVGESGSDVEVSADSGEYEVEDVEVTNEPSGEWDDGDRPRLEVTLSADGDDYYFGSGISKDDVELNGDSGTVTSVSRSGRESLTVKITLARLDGDGADDYDLELHDLEWDEDSGIASWEDAADGKRYEVRLYRDGSSVTSVLTTSDSSYDFSSRITRSGDYTFRVRAVYNSSNKGDWEESDTWYVTSSEAREISGGYSYSGDSSGGPGVSASASGSGGPGVSSSGAWLLDANGWWYCNADRSYTMNNWQYINGFWYYFDGNGYMVTGWIPWKGLWYYCGPSGAMLTNTMTPDGYYVDGNGVWKE